MNELITDLKSLELETLKNLKNSKASNTLRAYQADFKDFEFLRFFKVSNSRLFTSVINSFIYISDNH